MQSMTGFARSRAQTAGAEFMWEMRSVNHRYLDIVFKLPPTLRQLEPRIRERVHEVFARGRIEINLQIYHVLNDDLSALDQENLDALARLMTSIADRHPGLLPGSVSDVLRWPGILPEERLEDEACNLPGLDKCLDQLVQTRQNEGRRLGKTILEKLELCASVVDKLNVQIPHMQQQVKAKFQQRIDELENHVEPERVAQEVALLIIKNDVAEELDRLQSHLEESISLLKGAGPVGRRLDFLMQELHREANTLGAKAASTVMTKASIDLKMLIEQSREQVQNIE